MMGKMGLHLRLVMLGIAGVVLWVLAGTPSSQPSPQLELVLRNTAKVDLWCTFPVASPEGLVGDGVADDTAAIHKEIGSTGVLLPANGGSLLLDVGISTTELDCVYAKKRNGEKVQFVLEWRDRKPF